MQKGRILNYCFWTIQTVFIVLTGIIIVSSVAKAQSGRRVPPTVSTPTPTPEPTPTPQPTQEKTVKPAYSFKVVRYIPQTLYMEFNSPERMHSWVMERLRKSLTLEVLSGGEANRKEAIEMAKLSEETYIVYLQLDENQFAQSSRGTGSTKAQRGEIWISYYVYSPKTGKTAYSGTAYLQEQRQTGGVLGRSKRQMCYPNVYGDDYLLLGASFEVAERIMSSFRLPIPSLC